MNDVLAGLEGKVIESIIQEQFNGKDISITFTDGTHLVIGAVGDDACYVIIDKF